MFNFSRIVEEHRYYYYTPALMIIVELITLYIVFRYKKNDPEAVLFRIYILADIIAFISDDIILGFTGMKSHFYNSFIIYTNTIISNFELIIYFIYLSVLFKNKIVTKILIVLAILFLIASTLVNIPEFNIIIFSKFYTGFLIYVLELLILLPFCGLYFIRIFRNPGKLNLVEKPSFWIIMGVFFYASVSIPNLLLCLKIINYSSYGLIAALLFYIPLTLNYSFIAKAFLMKKRLVE